MYDREFAHQKCPAPQQQFDRIKRFSQSKYNGRPLYKSNQTDTRRAVNPELNIPKLRKPGKMHTSIQKNYSGAGYMGSLTERETNYIKGLTKSNNIVEKRVLTGKKNLNDYFSSQKMESKVFNGFPKDSGWNPISNNFRRVRKCDKVKIDHDVLNQNPKKKENWARKKNVGHRKTGSFQIPKDRFRDFGLTGERMSPRKGTKMRKERVGLKVEKNFESHKKPKREKIVRDGFRIPKREKMMSEKKVVLKVKFIFNFFYRIIFLLRRI